MHKVFAVTTKLRDQLEYPGDPRYIGPFIDAESLQDCLQEKLCAWLGVDVLELEVKEVTS